MEKISIETIAKTAYRINCLFCRALGDDSQVPWDEAPEWVRVSAVDGVNLFIKNPNITSRDLHTNWLRHKKSEGWIYGAAKDIKKKTHPCIMDYDDLPSNQCAKDALFLATVRGLIF